MNRTVQFIVLAVVFGCGLVVGSYGLGTGAAQQPPMPKPQANWRYQLTPLPDGSVVFLLDTATGQAWAKYGRADAWVDFKTPPSVARK